jgi:hypothetical protein
MRWSDPLGATFASVSLRKAEAARPTLWRYLPAKISPPRLAGIGRLGERARVDRDESPIYWRESPLKPMLSAIWKRLIVPQPGQ